MEPSRTQLSVGTGTDTADFTTTGKRTTVAMGDKEGQATSSSTSTLPVGNGTGTVIFAATDRRAMLAMGDKEDQVTSFSAAMNRQPENLVMWMRKQVCIRALGGGLYGRSRSRGYQGNSNSPGRSRHDAGRRCNFPFAATDAGKVWLLKSPCGLDGNWKAISTSEKITRTQRTSSETMIHGTLCSRLKGEFSMFANHRVVKPIREVGFHDPY